jgi:hypothetical protein
VAGLAGVVAVLVFVVVVPKLAEHTVQAPEGPITEHRYGPPLIALGGAILLVAVVGLAVVPRARRVQRQFKGPVVRVDGRVATGRSTELRFQGPMVALATVLCFLAGVVPGILLMIYQSMRMRRPRLTAGQPRPTRLMLLGGKNLWSKPGPALVPVDVGLGGPAAVYWTGTGRVVAVQQY